jgi:hypothetical protein
MNESSGLRKKMEGAVFHNDGTLATPYLVRELKLLCPLLRFTRSIERTLQK